MGEVEEWQCLLSLDGMTPVLLLFYYCYYYYYLLGMAPALLLFYYYDYYLLGMAPAQPPLPSTFRLRVSPDGGLVG